MVKIYASDKQFWGENDSQTIQNAVDHAEKTGINRVVIPRHNDRTGENIWNISSAILLPSNMTVVLEDAHLRLCDGVFDNIFRNRNIFTPEGNTLEGEQEGIHILGSGNALLDGGVHNGLVEQMHRDDPVKYPRLSVNLMIFLHNVRHFTVSGLHFVNARWWAVCCVYCRWGKIRDLDFRFHADHENQDGVDLRIGCEYITIENITGITGDDTVALTALPQDHLVPETALHVAGKSWDIHDITIRNIISSTHGCGCVRFLCEQGAKEYNITVDGVKNTNEVVTGSTILVGTTAGEFLKNPHKMGDFRNIVLWNITACGHRAITFCESVQNMVVENVTTYGDNLVGIRFGANFECDNLLIRNLTVNSDPATMDCAISTDDKIPADAIKGLRFENVTVAGGKHVIRGRELQVENLQYRDISVSYRTDEPLNIPSAYARYHRCYNGKVMTNRPADARYDEKGNLKT